MAEEKKFVVAKGHSFVGNKRSYKEGDEIDETAFKSKERFESFLKGDNPKIIPAPAGETKQSGDDENLDSVDVSSIAEKPTREALEKLILEKGLLNEGKIKKMSDENLLKFAVKKGFIQK